MNELDQADVDLVSGALVVPLWTLFLTGYGSGTFDRIGRELGSGLYDALHEEP